MNFDDDGNSNTTQETEINGAVPQQEQEQGDKGGGSGTVEQMARKLGEDPTSFTQRPDAVRVLEMMEEGVIITLTIRRPRFQSKLTAQDVGLDDHIISEAARDVLHEYFYLGKLSVLPKEYQAGLNSVESAARQCVARYSVKSHWGAFVPITNYEKWKAENAKHEMAFEELRDKILDDYDELTEQGVEAYRPMAEDIWERTHNQTGAAQAEFVEGYLNRIRQAVPALEEVAEAFEYRIEKTLIPIPSTLARDLEMADRIYKKRAAHDAQYQAEQERIERAKRHEREVAEARLQAEIQAATSKSRAEREVVEAQRRAELERIEREKRREQEQLEAQHRATMQKFQLQEQMERDVIQSAQQQRQELVDQFYTDVVGQINQIIYQVADNSLESLERNQGKLSGAISAQLSNLVTQLEGWNFMQNTTVADQIERLRAVLPANLEFEANKSNDGDGGGNNKDKAGLKLDTRPLSRVLSQLEAETEATLIELGHNPIKRVQRQAQPEQEYTSNDTDVDQPLASLDQVRKPRRYNSIFAVATPDNNGPKRRPRANSTLSVKPIVNNYGNGSRKQTRKVFESI